MLAYNEVLLLFSCLLSVVWRCMLQTRHAGCMSSVLTKRTLGINKHIYAYFHVPEPWLQFRRCTWHKKEEDYMMLVALSLSFAFMLLWWKGSALRGWNIYVRIFNLKVQAWVSNFPTSAYVASVQPVSVGRQMCLCIQIESGEHGGLDKPQICSYVFLMD